MQNLARHSSTWWKACTNQSRLFSGLAGEAGLSEEHLLLKGAADDFARKELAPYSAEWDRQHTFPVSTLQAAAQLGFAGLYLPEQYGGSAMSRADAAVIFEALAFGDVPVTAYLTIHNMVAGAILR